MKKKINDDKKKKKEKVSEKGLQIQSHKDRVT